MLNRNFILFLTSFITVFTSLVFISQYLNAKLKAAGYDFSRIILIGLPTNSSYDSTASASKFAVPWGLNSNMTQSTFDLNDFQEKGYAQAAALVLAVLSSVFIYFKFGAAKRKPVLDPAVWQEFTLKEKIVISPNTAIYRFALPHPSDVLGLPIGQHISVQAEIEGKEIMRSYTPTSSDDDLGHFDLLIKSYDKGNISRYVSLLKLGDKVRIKGPKGQFKYHPSLSREIGMIAGGTGITPMLQIIRAALKNPLDRTKLSLIYANVNPDDILLKKELDELAAKHASRFKVYYVLNNPAAGWTGGVGFVSKDQIEKHMPPTDANIKVLMCGPPPMMTAMKKHLGELNYPAPRTVSKLGDQVFLF
jgi:cytochrome-b5 reductase